MDRPDGQWGKFSFERQEAVFQWFVLTGDEARFLQAGAFQRPMEAAHPASSIRPDGRWGQFA